MVQGRLRLRWKNLNRMQRLRVLVVLLINSQDRSFKLSKHRVFRVLLLLSNLCGRLPQIRHLVNVYAVDDVFPNFVQLFVKMLELCNLEVFEAHLVLSAL